MRGVIAELSRDAVFPVGEEAGSPFPAVASHAAVAMIAVAGRPDDEMGDAAVLSHCRERLAAYKLPRAIRFVSDLPRASTGRILRRALRAEAEPATMHREDPVP